MRSLTTLVAFKVCWLAIVLGAVWSMEWAGLLAIAAFTAYEVGVRSRTHLLIPALVVGLVGYGVDNAYVATGLMSFSDPGIALAPYWMALLWVNFALIVEHGLAWLNGRPLLAAALGAIGGPMAYFAGVRFELITLIAPTPMVMGVIALTWAAAMPLLIRFLGAGSDTATHDALTEPGLTAQRF
ncbi:MAG: DUF2878 domain-containing protein [Gammaproteobacteria bacterium]